jgi:uncharacterized DUF497 family protein
MKVDGLEFDWDAGNRQKCQKHGLSARDIESIFKAPYLYFLILNIPARKNASSASAKPRNTAASLLSSR